MCTIFKIVRNKSLTIYTILRSVFFVFFNKSSIIVLINMQIISDWLSLSTNSIFKPWNWIYLEIKDQITYDTKDIFQTRGSCYFSNNKKFMCKICHISKTSQKYLSLHLLPEVAITRSAFLPYYTVF
jgi:hypothetical protein